jgi:hypothetical protein
MESSHPAGPPGGQSLLDGPVARLGALCILLLVAGSLAWIHRERLFPPEVGMTAEQDPAMICLAQRAADIDRMEADGTISAEQAVLFKSRAEALCRAQAGQAAAPLPD